MNNIDIPHKTEKELSIKVRAFILCDEILVDKISNRISLINIFDIINARNLPKLHQFKILLKLFLNRENHDIEIIMVSPNKKETPIKKINISKEEDIFNNTFLIFTDFSFEEPGLHSLKLIIDHSLITDHPIRVDLLEEKNYEEPGK